MEQTIFFPDFALQNAATNQVKNSPLRFSITANETIFGVQGVNYDDDPESFGDLYDEYEDFDVVCHKW